MIYVITVFISTVISHSLFFLRVPFFSTLFFPICKRHEPSFFFSYFTLNMYGSRCYPSLVLPINYSLGRSSALRWS